MAASATEEMKCIQQCSTTGAKFLSTATTHCFVIPLPLRPKVFMSESKPKWTVKGISSQYCNKNSHLKNDIWSSKRAFTTLRQWQLCQCYLIKFSTFNKAGHAHIEYTAPSWQKVGLCRYDQGKRKKNCGKRWAVANIIRIIYLETGKTNVPC